MKNIFIAILVVSMITLCQSKKENSTEKNAQNKNEIAPYIERIDSDLDKIIAPGEKVEVIAEGFEWSEGPVWINGIGLLFSDIPPNKIYKWTEDDGLKEFLNPSGYTGTTPRGGEKGSNGLLLDNDGKLVLCQHGDRRVARLISDLENPQPTFETIVSRYEGKKLNSPNDACFDSHGNLYFTDPPYGLEHRMDDPLKELDFQGVYRYSKSGEIRLLTDKLSRPNGIALSPDQSTLYVANSDPDKAIWMAYRINDQGNIQTEKVFYDATELVGLEPGLPDGLKVDQHGNIFASGPGGIWIFNSEGKVLGKVKTGQATSNCGIGNNGKALYITADMFIMKVSLDVS